MLKWAASNLGVNGQHKKDSEEDTRLGDLEGWWHIWAELRKEQDEYNKNTQRNSQRIKILLKVTGVCTHMHVHM